MNGSNGHTAGVADHAVVCQQLGRVYASRSLLGERRSTVALDGLDLTIPRGMVYGLLGPNGAGKTTTVRVLSTLLIPTSGSASVLGYDVVRQAGAVRRNIGLVLGGDRGLYGRLTGRENLLYYAALNLLAPPDAARRSDQLLEQVGLADRGDTLVEQYSRGMKQRLHLARGLLTDPAVLFLDEPTIGLDPSGAEALRQMVPQLAAAGKTILLTTHYMFEADRLCERIAIIDHGKLVAEGTPLDIKRRFSRLAVLEAAATALAPGALDRLREVAGVLKVDSIADGPLHRITLQAEVGVDIEAALVATLSRDDIISSVVRDPTLEEAYLNILR